MYMSLSESMLSGSDNFMDFLTPSATPEQWHRPNIYSNIDRIR
jgi:hypothetical protein